MAKDRDPISLNLARIVHGLLTRARGLRVDRLTDELNIEPRTYRKYRKVLQDRFEPFLREDGTSLIEEVRDGDARYLRLVGIEETSVGDREEFAARIAAIHLAQELFSFLAKTEIGQALRDLVAEFRHRTKDQAFVFNHILRNAGRMFYHVPYAPKDYSDQRDTLRVVLHSLIFTRLLEMEYDSASSGLRTMQVEPWSLMLHRGGLYLVARHVDYAEPRTFAVDRIRKATKLAGRFDYPPAASFLPSRFTEGCFGIFRENAGQSTDVELIFADKRWLQLDLTERRWHPTQTFEKLADGRLRMQFTVNSMVEVWPWIQSFGDNVEVIRPERPSDDVD